MFVALLAAAATSPLPQATPINIASWFRPDDYPAEAKAKGLEGTVVFDVDVDATGRPTACRILQPSSSQSLDEVTCRVVLARARFLPAKSHGKAVPGHFSKPAIWSLGGGMGLRSGYYAVIADLSGSNAADPVCSVITRDFPNSPTCSQILPRLRQFATKARLKKVVALESVSGPNNEPFRGDPAWGRRLSFTAIDLYPPKVGGKPKCELLAKEGDDGAPNPCVSYADKKSITDEDRKSPDRLHIELSLFGVTD